MGHGHLEIAVSELMLDQSNARLGEKQPNQQRTQVALAEILGTQLIEIAADIVANGLDPTAIPAVTQEGAPKGRYRVIEGNRRLLALKALDTPAIVNPALSASRMRQLVRLSELFRNNPIPSLLCALFDTEDEARHWIILRHTGANNGVGLVEWDSDDKDRYLARHGGLNERKPPGQIIDFVNQIYAPQPGDKRIFTTLDRIISTPFVRQKLGIVLEGGTVYSLYPGSEVLKGLGALVLDFRSGARKVKDVYYEDDRIKYIDSFGEDRLPDPTTRLPVRQPLTGLSITPAANASQSTNMTNTAPKQNRGATPENDPSTTPVLVSNASSSPLQAADAATPENKIKATRPSRAKPPKRRSTTIPPTCVLWIANQPRINAIYIELTRLDVDQFTNACAVSLRVLFELSVDHHIALHKIIPEQQRLNTNLAKKLKELADYLKQQGRIEESLKRAIHKVADGSNMFSASTATFNQYVHNQYAYPQPTELCTAWDEIQPFMQSLWTK